eukprot:TRINITY_DN1992_c0_g1_i3.p1 TRINITY_DN1992_c0_g1~~TRINITY_DN1992_c0_g1_i3.p1  ORF type:complete len:436 (+),score=102.24 TRINITY_DN1992_c0_g1_i3:122-1429(+)
MCIRDRYQRRVRGHCSSPMMMSGKVCVYALVLLAPFLTLTAATVITATVPDTISMAPTMNATSITACGVRVNWQAPSSNGGKPVLYYTLYATGGGTVHKKMAIVQGAATTTTFVTGLKRTTAYTFAVTSTNEIGESAKSSSSISITSQNFRKYIFVSDFLNDRVLRFDFATKAFVDVFVQKGSGGLRGPWGIAFNKYDDPAQPRTFYVSSEGTSSVLQYDACDGSFVKTFANVPGQPRGMKFHLLPSSHTPPRQQKMLLVASAYGDSILKYNALTGSPLGTYATGIDTPYDLVIGPQSTGVARDPEDIFVTSEHADAVIQFQNTTGAFKAKFTDKKVNYANGLVFGTHEQTSNLYVTGPYAGKVIVKFDQNNGTYIEHFEDKALEYPLGMVYHDRTLYVIDKNTIRTYDAETGEFLEVWSAHDGLMGSYLLFHDM